MLASRGFLSSATPQAELVMMKNDASVNIISEKTLNYASPGSCKHGLIKIRLCHFSSYTYKQSPLGKSSCGEDKSLWKLESPLKNKCIKAGSWWAVAEGHEFQLEPGKLSLAHAVPGEALGTGQQAPSLSGGFLSLSWEAEDGKMQPGFSSQEASKRCSMHVCTCARLQGCSNQKPGMLRIIFAFILKQR